MSLKQKVDTIIAETLPKGATYSLSLSKSAVHDMVIVRVITEAWKSVPAFIRVLRIQNALRENLPPDDLQKILRVSVFSPDQLKRVLLRDAILKASQKSHTKPSPLTAKIAAKLRAQRRTGSHKKLSNQALLRAALAKLRKSKSTSQ